MTSNYKSGRQQPSHGDRCLDLYARAKFGCYAAKQNVTTDEIEFKKQAKECTH
jgi:predicted signal transduction protein with EAL and GGDEF domain